MESNTTYPIGQANKKWGDNEKQSWLQMQSIKRSYADQVLSPLESTNDLFVIEQYGALSYDQQRYPLMVAKNREWQPTKPVVLITGGVHGYETSGVQGAIRFLQGKAGEYLQQFNIVVAPCISPWGYETINRWNPNCIDPNRSFYENSPAEESALIMQYIKSLDCNITVHIDLHETTDTDNSEFRPALSARDNEYHKEWEIPDGFYLVGDTDKPVFEFQKAIIKSVQQVTHIAPSDSEGRIIGELITQTGVINYDTKKLGLCAGFSDADFNTTTEVYPDSPKVDDENCILAQVAAVCGGLNYVIKST